MREIIFRGKRTDNGEWIQGDLRHITDLHGGYYPCIADNSNGRNNYASGVPIIPQSLGQYTGLTDKSGKKIFEGDIIKNNKGDYYEIAYLAKYTRFAPRKPGTVFAVFPLEDTTIIGNIYENPELL